MDLVVIVVMVVVVVVVMAVNTVVDHLDEPFLEAVAARRAILQTIPKRNPKAIPKRKSYSNS